MHWLNLATRLACTEAEGPGRRAAIWVQGCNKRCRGCCNPAYLPLVERDFVSASSVLDWLIKAHDEHNLEGLTLLGGEPMLQAQGLAVVARGAQSIGLSVMTFTGYTVEELFTLRLPGSDRLLDFTDVLVEGEFDSKLLDSTRPWVGSENQKFHYLSSKYGPEIEAKERLERVVELHFMLNGKVIANGWPHKIDTNQ